MSDVVTLRGTYRYTVWNKPQYFSGVIIDGSFTRHTLRVEILSETAKRYRVKFTAFHEDGRGPGTIVAVDKKNVKLDKPAPAEPPALEREIRLPYNDD